MVNENNPVLERELSVAEKDYVFDLLGYRVLHGAVSEDQLRRINAWVDSRPARKRGEWIGNVEVQSYQGHDGDNYQNIIEGGDVFEELIDNPAWIPEIERYICYDGNKLSINEAFLNVRRQSGFIGIHSGGHNRMLVAQTRHHAGGWMVGQINCLTALTDIGPGDGATVVVPGSHKSHEVHPAMAGGDQQVYRDDFAAGEAMMTTEVYLKAGDTLMFTDGICHGSAARTNPGERRVIIYRYCPHLMATRFNYLPGADFLARLTPRKREIVQPVPLRFPPGRTLP